MLSCVRRDPGAPCITYVTELIIKERESMAWWRVSNVPTAWPATEGQAPTAAPAPVLQVEQQGGYVGVPEQAPPAPPNHAIPHAAALKNARLALARLTESIQSIAHPSAQDAVSGPFGHAP